MRRCTSKSNDYIKNKQIHISTYAYVHVKAKELHVKLHLPTSLVSIAYDIHEDDITSCHVESGVHQDSEGEGQEDWGDAGSSERRGLSSAAVKRGWRTDSR